jgi:antiviral helicase SKI2
MLERQNLLPCVIFILSKARINELAEGLNALDLTINKEKGLIREFITKCVGRLRGSDRDLPQIVFLKELMIRGTCFGDGILVRLKHSESCASALL